MRRTGNRKHRPRRGHSLRWLAFLLLVFPLASAAPLRNALISVPALRKIMSPLEFQRSKLYRFAIQQGGQKDYLEPGDILLGRCAGSPVPSLHPEDSWTHAAIYVGNGQVVEAANPAEKVLCRRLFDWMAPRMTWVSYLRLPAADEDTKRLAVSFALAQVGQPYDINWLSKQADGHSWYCSELVWAAYLYGSGGAMDLAGGSDLFGVSPDDLAAYPGALVVGGHYEYKPGTIFTSLFAWFRQGLSALFMALVAMSLFSLLRLRWLSRRTGLAGWQLPALSPGGRGPGGPRHAFHFHPFHADSYHVR